MTPPTRRISHSEVVVRLPITSDQARLIGQAIYAADKRPPLSECRIGELHTISEWISEPRSKEHPKSPEAWKESGVLLYLALGAIGGAGTGAFPSYFEFSDGTSLRPDKGTIKVWIRADFLRAVCNSSDQVEGFILSDKGRDALVRAT
jgi:hypothetical protein